ncbi:MAG: sugar phosphate nucleotidyltransferase [Candidatus Binatia bacterium]
MVGVIPAAGYGTRAYPYTKRVPKCLLDVGGQPNLAAVIELMRDQLQIRRIIIITGFGGELIRERFGDGAAHGVELRYVENDAIERGLSYSLLRARPHVDDHFCVVLGDECYVDSNHAELLAIDYRRSLAVCGVLRDGRRELISENYGVHIANGRIRDIVEKPAEPGDAALGVGTFVFSPEIFTHFEAALSAGPATASDPVSVLGHLARGGAAIEPFYLRGGYVNINDRDRLNLANNLVRTRRFAASSMGLVLVAQGSDEEIERTVGEFRAAHRFDQVVLAVPAERQTLRPGGAEIVVGATARFGDLLRGGLDAVRTDIAVAALADGSSTPRDLGKLLEYLKDADCVVGTRTTRQLIEQGTNMRGIVRLAHVVLAKILELVWWQFEPRFTDIGCVYRALWTTTYRMIRPRLVTAGPEFAVEMLLEILQSRRRIIEIPVSFPVRRRSVREQQQTVRTFWQILCLIIARRLRAYRGES